MSTGVPDVHHWCAYWSAPSIYPFSTGSPLTPLVLLVRVLFRMLLRLQRLLCSQIRVENYGFFAPLLELAPVLTFLRNLPTACFSLIRQKGFPLPRILFPFSGPSLIYWVFVFLYNVGFLIVAVHLMRLRLSSTFSMQVHLYRICLSFSPLLPLYLPASEACPPRTLPFSEDGELPETFSHVIPLPYSILFG